MIKEWIRDNYEEVLSICRTITKCKEPDYEELAHEVMLMMLEQGSTLDALVKSGNVKFWVLRVCMNNYRSKTSRFHYKYRRLVEVHRSATEELKYLSELSPEDKQREEEMLEFIEEKTAEMPYFDGAVFRVYWEEGHSLNSLATATGINRSTLYKAITRTKEYISNEFERLRGHD